MKSLQLHKLISVKVSHVSNKIYLLLFDSTNSIVRCCKLVRTVRLSVSNSTVTSQRDQFVPKPSPIFNHYIPLKKINEISLDQLVRKIDVQTGCLSATNSKCMELSTDWLTSSVCTKATYRRNPMSITKQQYPFHRSQNRDDYGQLESCSSSIWFAHSNRSHRQRRIVVASCTWHDTQGKNYRQEN